MQGILPSEVAGFGRDDVGNTLLLDVHFRADGDGFHIRGGIIVVPKNGVIRPGTVI